EENTSGGSGDKKEMDLQKSALQENEDQEMDVEEDSSCSPYRPKLAPGKLEPFADLLSKLEARFRSQRPELWKRSKIHLEKHLKSAEPTEPVSLILTSGRSAEKTLSCLAEGLASAFSSALEASVLQIDGAGKAGMESDEVKLDVDGLLRTAFRENRAAAVIHRLEELPPGSTLIFYRYCDHEHAAYKEVFLLFTVLLPREEVSGELGVVEEMVQDYLKDRLVGPSNRTAFNEMDTDKFGGLWSRISHLVLPVVAEGEVEENGC
uniref:Torsin-1A-interacting protein 1/2 AAA+ activator domain-containing protein n=1 Tax=Hippocampus comes TaxID=109280 RepID=A0A3Q2YBW7_HIPCM